MKSLFFSTHDFERDYLKKWCQHFKLDVTLLDSRLCKETLDLNLISEAKAISCWANDDLSENILIGLKEAGIEYISLRSAGFSHLNLEKAKELGLKVARVPSYSPQAIAEHTLGLLMCLNRKFPRAFQRVKDFNFKLDGLEGVTLFGKTVGVVGVGQIGESFARIMKGFGCKILLYDPHENIELAEELGATYVDLKSLLSESDVVSLHCPLNEHTKYLINGQTIEYLKKEAFLLNTGRGALIETQALINKLKKKELRGVGLDVYENEEDVFAHDHSLHGISDEKLLRLMSFPNVLITSHQAFFTKEALDSIAQTACQNFKDFFDGKTIEESNLVC